MTPSRARQKSFTRQIGEDAVVWIRPQSLTAHTGSKWPVAKARLARLQRVAPRALAAALRPALKKREPFVIPARYFPAARPMTETPLYRKIADFIHRPGSVEETLWFEELARALERDGIARHKALEFRSRAEIGDFFAGYVLPLVDSLRRDGFRGEATGFESSAVIDAAGRLTKAGSGNHRFAMAHVLALPRFPLRIVGVHAQWYAREVLPQGDSWAALQAGFGAVAARHQ